MAALFDYFIIALASSASFVWGSNILKNDISRHTIFNLRKKSSFLSIILFLCVCLLLGYAFILYSPFLVSSVVILSLLVSFVLIYLITKLGPKRADISVFYYFITSFVVFLVLHDCFAIWLAIIWSVIYGFYLRNSPFSAPHLQYLILPRLINYKLKSVVVKESASFTSKLYSDFLQNKNKSILQDFSYAGYGYGNIDFDTYVASLERFDVRDFGIYPDLKYDLTVEIQNAINKVGERGGGVLFFPNGIYNLGKQGRYIQVNHSNIVIQGESKDTVFVSHHHTLRGDKNPWLSPFLFTTGEQIQESNIFFGVQFKKKKNIVTRSASLTDPGSDGSILQPEFITEVIKDAKRGDNILFLKDTGELQKWRYVILALFNSDGSDELLKGILDVEAFREEWQTANRAQAEIAPSFQWLIEVDEILDNNRVRLKQPLRRDIEKKFTPEMYGVEMLENVGFMNFTMKSKWNGIFRHHGFPIYYSKKESQIMDYGWNGINMKRVAHGFIQDVIIENFTNPLYVQDSRNTTHDHIQIKGSSGHQGIKLYGHSSDNLFRNIRFETDYADMMGGEGNCYGNVFTNIQYNNVENSYVDFDFHGFSEGPFSPPANNLFELIYGFRGIKGSGALYNQPACATYNVWWNISAEGYNGFPYIFVNLAYCKKSNIGVHLSSLRHAVVTVIQNRKVDRKILVDAYLRNVKYLRSIPVERRNHFKLFKSSIISGYWANYDLRVDDSTNKYIFKENINGERFSFPISLYSAQKEIRFRSLMNDNKSPIKKEL